MMAPHEVVSSFLDAMRAAGIEPAESIADALLSGERARFQCVGDSKGRKNGWARLYLDGRPAGAFGSYKGDRRVTWTADVPAARFIPEERAAYRAKRDLDLQAKAAEKAARHKAVADEAQAMIISAEAATADHPYLVRKRVNAEGLYIAGKVLLAPMRDAKGLIWNVQRIHPDGAKLFLKGGRVDGVFWSAGFVENGLRSLLCIGEGIATMKAVRRATGHDVVAAISAGNLETVALTMRQRWPDRPMVICADDDAHLVNHPRIRRNIGVDAAKAAAAAIGARVALPLRSSANG